MADGELTPPQPTTLSRVLRGESRLVFPAVVALAALSGGVAAWLVRSSWIPGPLDERWSHVLPPGLAALAALTTLAGIAMPPDAELLSVRRGGLDGGDLRVRVDNRALTLLVACILAALAAGSTSVGRATAGAPPAGPATAEAAPAATASGEK